MRYKARHQKHSVAVCEFIFPFKAVPCIQVLHFQDLKIMVSDFFHCGVKSLAVVSGIRAVHSL